MIQKLLLSLLNSLKGIKHWTLHTIARVINYIRDAINLYRDDLTAAEHSTLVMLLLAIQATPHKTADLLKLAVRDDIYHNPKGPSYLKQIDRLHKALDKGTLLKTVEKMRKELRER